MKLLYYCGTLLIMICLYACFSKAKSNQSTILLPDNIHISYYVSDGDQNYDVYLFNDSIKARECTKELEAFYTPFVLDSVTFTALHQFFLNTKEDDAENGYYSEGLVIFFDSVRISEVGGRKYLLYFLAEFKKHIESVANAEDSVQLLKIYDTIYKSLNYVDPLKSSN